MCKFRGILQSPATRAAWHLCVPWVLTTCYLLFLLPTHRLWCGNRGLIKTKNKSRGGKKPRAISTLG